MTPSTPPEAAILEALAHFKGPFLTDGLNHVKHGKVLADAFGAAIAERDYWKIGADTNGALARVMKSRAESAEAALAEAKRGHEDQVYALNNQVARIMRERDEALAEVERVKNETENHYMESIERLTSLLAATREALNDTDLISSERVAKALALTPAKPTEDDNG